MVLKRRGEVVQHVPAEREGAAEQGSTRRANPGLPWDEPRTCRVVWGEEKLSPIPNSYSSVTVGPFEIVFLVPAGQAPGPYWDRANRELAEMAEVERERKITSFINKLVQTSDRVKGGRV